VEMEKCIHFPHAARAEPIKVPTICRRLNSALRRTLRVRTVMVPSDIFLPKIHQWRVFQKAYLKPGRTGGESWCLCQTPRRLFQRNLAGSRTISDRQQGSLCAFHDPRVNSRPPIRMNPDGGPERSRLPQAAPLTKHKVVFLGDQGTGKTTMIKAFMYGTFEQTYKATVGIDFFSKTLYLDDRTVRLQIWDSAGQE
jgi:hypothetical protein